MIIKETPERLVIKDTPGWIWLFSSFFLVVGGLFVLGPLFFNSDRFDQPWYVNWLGVALGSISVATGLWIIGRTPASKVIFDRLAYRVILRQGWRMDGANAAGAGRKLPGCRWRRNRTATATQFTGCSWSCALVKRSG